MKILIEHQSQQLFLQDEQLHTIKNYPISTAAKGLGEQADSFQTPRGLHQIRAKIGAGADPNAVFVARRASGELFSDELFQMFPGRDWILSRILWLSGLEPGKNRLHNVDTMRRFIYIHGTPYESELGTPASHGCIRMSALDIIEIFDRVDVGTQVLIK